MAVTRLICVSPKNSVAVPVTRPDVAFGQGRRGRVVHEDASEVASVPSPSASWMKTPPSAPEAGRALEVADDDALDRHVRARERGAVAVALDRAMSWVHRDGARLGSGSVSSPKV
jgi:hypothetical protein